MDAVLHTNQSLAAGADTSMHPIGQCLKDTVVKSVTEFLSLFYLMSPYETSKEDAYDVPDYEVVVSFPSRLSRLFSTLTLFQFHLY